MDLLKIGFVGFGLIIGGIITAFIGIFPLYLLGLLAIGIKTFKERKK